MQPFPKRPCKWTRRGRRRARPSGKFLEHFHAGSSCSVPQLLEEVKNFVVVATSGLRERFALASYAQLCPQVKQKDISVAAVMLPFFGRVGWLAMTLVATRQQDMLGPARL